MYQIMASNVLKSFSVFFVHRVILFILESSIHPPPSYMMNSVKNYITFCHFRQVVFMFTMLFHFTRYGRAKLLLSRDS